MIDRHRKTMADVARMGGDIVSSERFTKAESVPHHHVNGNIAIHSVETAGYALRLTRWLNRHGQNLDERDVVRASLLHDIGMTEDDVFLSPSSEKANTHPVESARIAAEEFGANDEQVDAILHHMWPVGNNDTPNSATGWVVSAADKICSVHDIAREAARTIRTTGKEIKRIVKEINEEVQAERDSEA